MTLQYTDKTVISGDCVSSYQNCNIRMAIFLNCAVFTSTKHMSNITNANFHKNE